MTDPLEASTFGRIVADLGYPGVTLGAFGLEAGGRDSWAPVLAGALRGDRHLLLPALHSALLSGLPPGRARLARAHRTEPVIPLMSPDEHRSSVRDRLVYVGDVGQLDTVIDGLMTCPECVQDHVLRSTAWLSVCRSRAWTTSSTFRNKEGARMSRIVTLHPDADAAVVRHEAVHIWFAPADSMMALTAQGAEGLRRVVTSPVMATIDEARAREERFCDALARLWSQRDWSR